VADENVKILDNYYALDLCACGRITIAIKNKLIKHSVRVNDK
jgi:hypothetical protein